MIYVFIVHIVHCMCLNSPGISIRAATAAAAPYTSQTSNTHRTQYTYRWYTIATVVHSCHWKHSLFFVFIAENQNYLIHGVRVFFIRLKSRSPELVCKEERKKKTNNFVSSALVQQQQFDRNRSISDFVNLKMMSCNRFTTACKLFKALTIWVDDPWIYFVFFIAFYICIGSLRRRMWVWRTQLHEQYQLNWYGCSTVSYTKH